MTLTTHAITGAALASLTPNQPLVGFAVGFVSHFVLDAIPHWDYPLASQKRDGDNPLNDDIVINKDFVKDLFIIGFDGVIGLLLACLFYIYYLKYSALVILCGIVGATLPDALQFIQIKFKHEPFNTLRKFHIVWIHSKTRLDSRPFLGILLQIIIIGFVMWLANFMTNAVY